MDRNLFLILLLFGLKVALRKESVDRNFYYADKDADWVRSLSARRAWIEMVLVLSWCIRSCRRSPQGERG